MANIPGDPIMLLSYLNTQLRDRYPDLASACEDLMVSEEEIVKKLEAVGYQYDPEQNRFL